MVGSGLPLAVATVLLAAGVAAKLSCLGADGLTLGETALPWCYSDVVGLAQARGLVDGPLPYREVMTEYPPLTALQWWVAGRLSSTVSGFYLLTASVQAAAVLVTVGLLDRAGLPRRRVLLVAGAPALLLTATVNWDPVAVALLTAGVLADRRGRVRTAGVLLGLGGLAKVFPLLAVAVILWRDVRAGRTARGLGVATAALGTVLVVQVPVALWSPEGWDAWLRLNVSRPVDWDSVWYGLQVLGGRALPTGPTAIAIGVVTVAGWLVVLRSRRWAADPLPAVVAWLLLAGKVWSPQFTLWLLPLLALSRVPVRLVWPFLLADAAVVVTRFPFLAGQQGISPSVSYGVFASALLARGVLLLAIMLRGPADGVGQAPVGPPPSDG